MRSLRPAVLAALLAFPLLAQDAKPEREIATDALLRVITGEEMTTAEGRVLLQRVRSAYDFVAAENAWAVAQPTSKLLTVRVLPDAQMRKEHPNARGVAKGDTFVIGIGYLSSDVSARTLAHELTHLQDNLRLKKKKAPRYVKEGRAISLGIAWCEKQKIDDDRYERSIARVLSKMTGDEMKQVLEKDPDKGFPREAVGFFFVEWLRTKGGHADAVRRLARVLEATGDTKKPFATNFQEKFQTKLEEAHAAFVAHVTATENKPRERFAGTVIAKFLARKPEPKKPDPKPPEKPADKPVVEKPDPEPDMPEPGETHPDEPD